MSLALLLPTGLPGAWHRPLSPHTASSSPSVCQVNAAAVPALKPWNFSVMPAGRPDLQMLGHVTPPFWKVQVQKQILSEPGTFRNEQERCREEEQHLPRSVLASWSCRLGQHHKMTSKPPVCRWITSVGKVPSIWGGGAAFSLECSEVKHLDTKYPKYPPGLSSRWDALNLQRFSSKYRLKGGSHTQGMTFLLTTGDLGSFPELQRTDLETEQNSQLYPIREPWCRGSFVPFQNTADKRNRWHGLSAINRPL